MRIFLLVSSMEGGGAERVAATLANAWAERGEEVTIVATFSRGGGCRYPLGPNVRFVRLVDISVGWPMAYPSRLVRLRVLRHLIVTERPDVVVSLLTNVNVAGILATRGLDIPVVVSERIHPLATPWGRRVLRRLTYPMADVVVVQTEEAARAIRRLVGRAPVAVLPNPLPAELQARDPRGRCNPASRHRLVGMGRLERQKGFDLLIRIFYRLAQEFPDWDLWIWGEGSQRRALEAQVVKLGLEPRVFLPGWTSEPWDELERADVFVLPSRWEGFPNALLEAMALGVPCVAYDCPAGPREITRGGQDAMLVPAEDELAMEDALRTLMTNEALRTDLGARGAVSVRERYALPRVITMWDELFRTVGVACG